MHQRYSPLAGIDRTPLLSVTPRYCFRYTAKNEAVDHDKAVICVGTEERRAEGFFFCTEKWHVGAFLWELLM
jgi:hypothetical protein